MSKIDEQVKTLEPKKKTAPALSEKRKRAMVEYIASMFFVAFVLVLVSLFVQNRSLKQATTENINTSLTLEGRLENMQTENRELREKLAALLFDDAVEANNAGKTETFAAAMEELAPYSDSLSNENREAYEQLCRLLPAEPEE